MELFLKILSMTIGFHTISQFKMKLTLLFIYLLIFLIDPRILNPHTPWYPFPSAGHIIYVFLILIVCFTNYFVFSIAVHPHSPGVVYYHLLLRLETMIPGVAPFSFNMNRNRNLGSFRA